MTYAQAVAKVASDEAAIAALPTAQERYEAGLKTSPWYDELQTARLRVAELQEFTAAGSVSAIP